MKLSAYLLSIKKNVNVNRFIAFSVSDTFDLSPVDSINLNYKFVVYKMVREPYKRTLKPKYNYNISISGQILQRTRHRWLVAQKSSDPKN